MTRTRAVSRLPPGLVRILTTVRVTGLTTCRRPAPARSAAELCRDVLMDRAYDSCMLLIEESELPAIRAGACISRVVNPVTRTVVKIRTKPGGKRETARVRVMGGTYRQTWWPAST